MNNEFDAQYYVMSADGANNHPQVSWGDTDFTPFLDAEPINNDELELPLNTIFDEPYPKKYEMADLHMLDADFAISKKFMNLLERLNVYGVQYFPIVITSNKNELINDFFYIHFCNRLQAIDENNYEGGAPNRFGLIHDLKRFSLNANLLKNTPLEQRFVFLLKENPAMIIVHQSIREAIEAAGLTGMRFFRVDEWDEDAMFR